MDRFRMLPNYRYYDDSVGVLETRYAKQLRDYQIYGNSIQDGTPSPDNPVEIQSVGEKTKNLFDINNIETISTGITNNGDGSITVSNYPSSTAKFLYELCPSMKIGQTIAFSMVTNGYHQIYLNNTTSGVKTYLSNNKSFVVTEDILNSKVSFYRQSSAQGGGDAIISNIQFEEGTEVTPFEPYGKYKIPIEVSGKNLFNETNLINLGFELQEDSSYFGDSYAIGTQTIWTNTEGLKGSFYIDGVMTSDDGLMGYAIRTLYTDGTSMWGIGVTNENKIVDCVNLNYSRQKKMYLSKFIIANSSIATAYEPYREPQTYNIFLDEPLRKCGDYADYIDFKTGKLFKNTRYYESIYDAIISKSSDNRWGWGVSTPYKKTWGTIAIAGSYNEPPMSSHFLTAITGAPSYAMDAHIQKSTQNNAIYGAFPYTFFEEFKGLEANTFPNLEVGERAAIIDEWMIANEVDYLTAISTPVETIIELPEIKLHEGTNIIKVKTPTQPSQLNWQYYK